MLKPLLKLAATAATYYAASQLTNRNYMGGKNFKALALGVGLLVASLALALIGITILIVALFFHLADLVNYVMPALTAGGIGLVLALLALFEGLRHFRRY